MKKLFVLTACICAMGWSIRCENDDDDDDEYPESIQSRQVFENRIWLSHLPEKPEDVIDLVAFVDGKMGIYGQASEYVAYQEIFFWDRVVDDDDEGYELYFPHRDKKDDTLPHVWECNEPPFELCVEFDTDVFGERERYYSRWDFVIEQKEGSDFDTIPLFWPQRLDALSQVLPNFRKKIR